MRFAEFTTFSVCSPVIMFILGFFAITAFPCGIANALPDGLLEPEFEYDTRPREYGLNRVYTAEFKRLPVYDFGLGKRFDSEDKNELGKEYDEYPNNDEEELMPELELYTDEGLQSVEKRQNAYNFGLGKRHRGYDFGLGKRGRNRYDFGLGKRTSPSLYHRDRVYNMGLGKRTRLYSFGLGKRPYSQGAIGSRFNFGLGKRSNDINRNLITKREVPEMRAGRTAIKETAEKSGKSKGTTQIDLEQVDMTKQPGRNHLRKRSPYSYEMETANDLNDHNTVEFSRQFRKPVYNFGLGKRTSSMTQTEKSLK